MKFYIITNDRTTNYWYVLLFSIINTMNFDIYTDNRTTIYCYVPFAACRTIQTERFEIVNQTESSETVLLPILLLYDASKCIQKTSFAFES